MRDIGYAIVWGSITVQLFFIIQGLFYERVGDKLLRKMRVVTSNMSQCKTNEQLMENDVHFKSLSEAYDRNEDKWTRNLHRHRNGLYIMGFGWVLVGLSFIF